MVGLTTAVWLGRGFLMACSDGFGKDDYSAGDATHLLKHRGFVLGSDVSQVFPFWSSGIDEVNPPNGIHDESNSRSFLLEFT
jgi:hypothetical protein